MAEVTFQQCIDAKVIAMSDTEVQRYIIANLRDACDFTGISCLNESKMPEQVEVLLSFNPPSWMIGPPSLLVTVSLTEHKVLQIDPYIPSAG